MLFAALSDAISVTSHSHAVIQTVLCRHLVNCVETLIIYQLCRSVNLEYRLRYNSFFIYYSFREIEFPVGYGAMELHSISITSYHRV